MGQKRAVTVRLNNVEFANIVISSDSLGMSVSEFVCDLIAQSADRIAYVSLPDAGRSRAELIGLKIWLDERLIEHLDAIGAKAGVSVAAFIENVLRAVPKASGAQPLGYLRTVKGRGKIYGMYFEIAGYQYALLRHLGGDHSGPSTIMDAAFLALARQAAYTGRVGDLVVSDEGRAFAQNMLARSRMAARD